MPDAPLIAVTSTELRGSTLPTTKHADPARNEMVLGLRYLEALERAGGIPLVCPALAPEAIEPLLDRIDGLCLSGGPDIDPSYYGELPHAELGPTEPRLDEFELELVRAADERGLPILAVCRGLQLLNVARGGTLHQHLPDVVGTVVGHRQEEAGSEVSHAVKLAPGSHLQHLLGDPETAEVNSFHHQAIKDLGRDLTPVAWAPDGTIEGVEDPGKPFLVAVQWHAESLTRRPEQAALWAAFVAAAAHGGSPRGFVPRDVGADRLPA